MQPSEEIKQKLDIVDVIREYIPLKAAGMNFRAICPFHREKSPSFMVSPDKQIWHCFGCSKGGDIFSFVQEIEGVDFVEALRILAPKAGVVLTRQDPKLQSRRNRVLDVLELARKYYHRTLMDAPAAKSAREYLARRGLKEDTIELWQIGYSPDSWDLTGNFLRGKGFNDQELFLAGMTAKSDTSSRYYDRFRGRIMFPINDVNGNTAAFSARVSPEKEATEKMGKYINSPQTIVYDKSKILFGLDKAKLQIKQQDRAIIVEGQMDVITAHQAGFANVIASSGTALTADQIQILKRYSQNIALSFDMDAAGAMAADRGIREAMRAEMSISVIEVPSGKDPDECIRENPAGWRMAVDKAKPMMQYYFDRVFSSLDTERVDDRRQAAKELLPIIVRLGNRIEQDFWLKTLSQQIDVQETLLREAISQAASKEKPAPEAAEQNEKASAPKSREEKMSELLLALVFKFPELFEYILQNIQIEHIQGDVSQALYRNLLFYYNKINSKNNDEPSGLPVLNYQTFKQWLKDAIPTQNGAKTNDSQLKTLDRLVFLAEKEYSEIELNSAKLEVARMVGELKKNRLARRMREIERQVAAIEHQGNKDDSLPLMEELKYLSEEIRGLSQD